MNRLESQLKGNLHLTRGSCPVRPRYSSGDNPECGVRLQVIGLLEMWVIEDVVAFSTELKSHPLCKLHLFSEVQVKVHKARSVELVSANASSTAE